MCNRIIWSPKINAMKTKFYLILMLFCAGHVFSLKAKQVVALQQSGDAFLAGLMPSGLRMAQQVPVIRFTCRTGDFLFPIPLPKRLSYLMQAITPILPGQPARPYFQKTWFLQKEPIIPILKDWIWLTDLFLPKITVLMMWLSGAAGLMVRFCFIVVQGVQITRTIHC